MEQGNDEHKTKKEKGAKYVTFFLGEEEYGLPISQVQEINRVSDITRVPNSPDHVLGVTNLRGKIIPVIELKSRMNLGITQTSKENRVVVVDHGTRLLGFMVDRVSKVVTIPTSQIEEAPEELIVEDNLVEGVAKLEESRLVILLNPERIMLKPQ